MTARPQRPPRPDEEDLIHFHNGDTLDNIPIIKPPEAAPWRRFLLTAGAIAVPVAAVGALVGAAAAELADGRGPRTEAQPPAKSSQTASVPPAEPSARPSPSESLAVAAQPQLEQVNVIQAPATGGDPATSYCLVYTGSDSAGVKDAILLANAPAYQCADLLPSDPEDLGAFSAQAPSCDPPARAAVLSFAETSEWAGTVSFTCLTLHTGA
ncbi:hypothetical protein AB0N62_43060 [Streptomyces sp. NPDC093982]|uniref:hypothetical protein n=1 Tax=Streptomyces sp. NPDC093982 TaxID=3155077 RepID=UPI0034297019